MTHEELKTKREVARKAEEARIASFYKPLTAEEKARREKRRQINHLKHELSLTDYQALKHSEGWISDEDYASIKASRQELRDRINELEEELK